MAERLQEDPRNGNVSIWAYHKYAVMPSTLVIDLRRVSDQASTVEILRALFQAAESLKDKKFEKVELAYKGNPKLMLKGDYFRTIGDEFQSQNPIYTIRTLPQNVLRLDGSNAYSSWTGGWLGVMGKQLEDVNKFARDWYLDDWTQEGGS